MEFYLGGSHQGKLELVKRRFDEKELTILDGESVDLQLQHLDEMHGQIVFNHLHLWVKRCLENEISAKEELENFMNQHFDAVLICDEVGNGVVPMEQSERIYRDEVGRIQIMLAKRADQVYRVICGIEQRLK